MDYNGGALIGMKGKDCVAIATDKRFGIQAQTVSLDFTVCVFDYFTTFYCLYLLIILNSFLESFSNKSSHFYWISWFSYRYIYCI